MPKNEPHPSLTLFRRTGSKVGSKVGLGEALSGLAALAQQRGDIEGAQNYYEKSLEIFRKAHDPCGKADVLYRLGFLALRLGNIDAALNYYEESLKIRLELGNDDWGEGVIRYSLGLKFRLSDLSEQALASSGRQQRMQLKALSSSSTRLAHEWRNEIVEELMLI